MALFGIKEEMDNRPGKGPHITNQFMEGTVIHGDVKAAHDIRIDGYINGTVQASAKLVIGKTGRIEGDIVCGSADIEGKVTGTLQVKELLILKATAVIEGDITSNKLVVEQGAKFNGTCTMGTKEMKHERTAAGPILQKETA
ncbi:MAG: polymer-forming cytoskeletal protein [Chitinophagales bacterium]|nr:polymer-forming cytoskeletal protein [Chitinophagales bacterium]